MKTKVIITITTILICAKVDAQVKNFGGPDGYGYIFKTNQSSSGNSFNWIDISSIGTQIGGLGDDSNVGPFNIGFDFPFYGNNQSTFYVCSNGFISFGSGFIISSGSTPYFPPLPTSDAYSNYLALYNTDLTFSGSGNSGKVYYYSNNSDSLVVSFVDVPYWIDNANTWGGSNTFQLILNASDSSITYQYLSMNGSWNDSYNTGAYQTVIGIESSSSTYGLEVAHSLIPQNNLNIYIKTGCFKNGDTTNIELCKGDTFYIGSQLIIENSLFADVLPSSTNCDSVVAINITIKSIADTIVQENAGVLTVNNSTATFEWFDCLTNTIFTETSSSFTAPYSGSFAVNISQDGCTFTSKCYSVIIDGLNENLFNTFLSPNPTTGLISIHSLDNIQSIKVFDIYGKELQNIQYQSQDDFSKTINLSAYPKGLYFVHILGADNRVIEKIVKQ